MPESPHRAPWARTLRPYAEPRLGRALLDLATSVVPYLLLTVAIYRLSRVSAVAALALSVPTAGFLVRTFVVFHDCTHGSLLPSRRANALVGPALGMLVLAPFSRWRHDHARHHASSGDLERRGAGDVPTLTVTEFYDRDWRGRLSYRMIRNPLVMFGLGPIFAMVIGPRIPTRAQRPRLRHSVLLLDATLAVAVTALCVWIGVGPFLITWAPAALMAGSAGIWLFYVQHQFEDAYWQDSQRWSYAEAALQGSSYLKLGPVLQFFSANIGLHHVHHLCARIPNYNLQRAHDENEMFHQVPVLTLRDGIRATRLKLYDPGLGRMVTFAEARARPRDTMPPAPAPSPAGAR